RNSVSCTALSAKSCSRGPAAAGRLQAAGFSALDGAAIIDRVECGGLPPLCFGVFALFTASCPQFRRRDTQLPRILVLWLSLRRFALPEFRNELGYTVREGAHR